MNCVLLALGAILACACAEPTAPPNPFEMEHSVGAVYVGDGVLKFGGDLLVPGRVHSESVARWAVSSRVVLQPQGASRSSDGLDVRFDRALIRITPPAELGDLPPLVAVLRRADSETR